ncbi:hypothetical protein EVAR_80182_1 [Eumeta japonica]|uniref:Uncharacterized protein n=1 Tax=Eumeta variegata TaxID=151549 RepID=A0A4C1THM5_EUMVA|nr:hypothetical protein EVAR_80182_1 [Eumeta japonica]
MHTSAYEIQVLHGDLELPTTAKFMKDTLSSQEVFDIAKSHASALLRSTVSYEPPRPHYFIRKPRNVHTDPPNALTVAVESLMEVKNTND